VIDGREGNDEVKDYWQASRNVWYVTEALTRFLIAGLLVLLSGTARADGLPKSIQGLWAFEPGDCANPGSDGLLKIGAKTVMFFASGYDITHVVRRPDGSLSASGFVSNEGEPGRDRGLLTLKLMSPDKLHVLDHTYQRCPN
jgi:hypothetical protein